VSAAASAFFSPRCFNTSGSGIRPSTDRTLRAMSPSVPIAV
jgi:hypothetical protein